MTALYLYAIASISHTELPTRHRIYLKMPLSQTEECAASAEAGGTLL